MIAYKLFRKRTDNTYGPLFINRKQRLEKDVWYFAEDHKTKGYAHRPGWHSCEKPVAPHLSKKDRVWCKVKINVIVRHQRPESQGGLWFTSEVLKIIEEL
jgi:hypothetical protein